MFRATLIHHLALVKCSAAGARDAMGAGRLTEGLAALQGRTTPDVHDDTAVHVLVVGCKFQRIARDVLSDNGFIFASRSIGRPRRASLFSR
jgi:hypothetical protein